MGDVVNDASNAIVYEINCRTSVTRPVTAEAAAVSGDANSVRPPLPCRPSKLRFDVDTLYSPGES
jgi:hypothetical protein